MTRQLQNRLALATVKVQNGWERLSIDSIEPQIEQQLKRKRPESSNGPISDTSSRLSDRSYPPSAFDSSPLAPMFSDDIARSGSSGGYSKRARRAQTASSSHGRRGHARSQHGKTQSWKSSYRLPESSPAHRNRYALPLPGSHGPSLSFVSATTLDEQHDDRLSLSSEDDDADLPLHSFQTSGPAINSSPPRTPPSMTRSARPQSRPFKTDMTTPGGPADINHGEEGAADLLMYLAASPSPAHPTPSRNHSHTPRGLEPPSTPPARHTPLPSSMMNTPGGTSANFLGFGAATPGMNFNFSDYLNVTPSPAQAAWRTPGALTRTPLAAREARRRLNFDAVAPGGGSPSIGPAPSKTHGLGMELGGELVSSQ